MGSSVPTIESTIGKTMSGGKQSTIALRHTASQRFYIRPLTADDSMAYCALRQRILMLGDGCYFSDSYEREKQLETEQAWRNWCKEKRGHCIIGTFKNKELVGVMMITRQGAVNSLLVEWEATWLDPRYRGNGLAKDAYAKVAQWSKSQGYNFAAVFIRADNTFSQEIRRKQGFIYAYTIYDDVWADGSVADAHAYILDLRPSARRGSKNPALLLEEALVFLNEGPHAVPNMSPDKQCPRVQEPSLALNSTAAL